MTARRRAQKYELTQEEKEAVRNITLILAESRANIAHLELIWNEVKNRLVVDV